MQSVDGILAPVINGSRYLVHISSKKKKILQLPEIMQNSNTEKIGSYIFSKAAFAWARKILLDCIDKNPEWLVIDEIGLLELDDRGLEPAVTEILNNRSCSIKNIVLVVRDNLIPRVIKYYSFLKREIFYFNPEGSEYL